MNNDEKKEYSTPELIEWGSVIELTLGGFFGMDDAVKGNGGDSNE